MKSLMENAVKPVAEDDEDEGKGLRGIGERLPWRVLSARNAA